MLTVRNLPPEPNWQDRLRQELPLLKGLGLWLTALICAAILGRSDLNENCASLSADPTFLVTVPAGPDMEAPAPAQAAKDLRSCAPVPIPFGQEASLLAP